LIRRSWLCVVAALALVSSAGEAQQPSRATLLRSAQTAYDDFAPDRALDFARQAVDPTLGSPDSTWTRGVHLLTQILIETQKPDVARAWARWAMRMSPSFVIDTVNFVADVGAALREARTFTSNRSPGDAVTQTSWRWPARGSTETTGRVVIGAGAMTVPVSARVVGGALVPAGATGLALPPGSYEFEAAAVGYLPVRVTREILPGATTVLTFALTSAAVATREIGDDARRHALANTAALSVRRFGTPPSCAVGTYVGRDGMLLTSYQAIRGADSVTLDAPGSPRVTVSAYDIAADLAVLKVAGSRTDSILPASAIVDGQSLWSPRLTNCAAPTLASQRLVQWTNRPSGALELRDPMTGSPAGAALFDVDGRLVGMWTGSAALPSTRIAVLLDQARGVVALPQSVADVARKENHTYGSFAIASDAVGTTIKVTPAETWQWEQTAASGPAPLTFVGPMGRYRVEASGPAGARREQEILVRPGTLGRAVISFRTVAEGPSAVRPAKKKSKLPWILAGAGAAAGAAVALGGGGGGSPPPPKQTGSITISIPVNP